MQMRQRNEQITKQLARQKMKAQNDVEVDGDPSEDTSKDSECAQRDADIDDGSDGASVRAGHTFTRKNGACTPDECIAFPCTQRI
jgi:hypothetical protein